MKKTRRLILAIFLSVLTIFIGVSNVKAEDISTNSEYYINNELASNELKDYNENSYIEINANDKIKIKSKTNIVAVYIVYNAKSQTGNVYDKKKSIKIGTNGFLHEYIEVSPSKEINIQFDANVSIAEIYVLSSKDRPSYVEKWEKPLEGTADLLFLSTHFDDEVYTMLGVVPTYVARGYNVQLVYFTYPNFNEEYRYHEVLHGLYSMGIRNYPIIGIVRDVLSENLDDAISNMNADNITLTNAVDFLVKEIRKLKPRVIVGHDINGEYGHGQHMLSTHALKLAVEKTNDKNYHLESFNVYGIWDTPKTYLHLYEENKITLDFDTQLDYYNGKTAFEVSKEAFSHHKSQQYPVMIEWLYGANNNITKASEIDYMPPTEYGLYRNLVDEDVNKDDIFEHIILDDKGMGKEEIIKGKNNQKHVIKNLHNIFTVLLVIFAVMLFFEISPMNILNSLKKLKDLALDEFKDWKKNLKIETENIKENFTGKSNKKKTNTAKKKSSNTTKKTSISTKKTTSTKDTSKTGTRRKTSETNKTKK